MIKRIFQHREKLHSISFIRIPMRSPQNEMSLMRVNLTKLYRLKILMQT